MTKADWDLAEIHAWADAVERGLLISNIDHALRPAVKAVLAVRWADPVVQTEAPSPLAWTRVNNDD